MNRNTLVVAVACGLAGVAVGVGYKADARPGDPPSRPAATRPVASPTHTSTLPHCQNEDGSGGPLPCRWDGSHDGNGEGLSYTITKSGLTVYDMPKGWPHVGHELADALAESGAPHADTYRWESCVVDVHHYKIVICPNGMAADL